jgi:hypothetical protein
MSWLVVLVLLVISENPNDKAQSSNVKGLLAGFPGGTLKNVG